MAVAQIIALLVAILILLVGIITFVTFQRVFSLWLQAFMSGTPVSMLEIIGMRFRRVDPRVVIKALIMATQAGVRLSCQELERAYLEGADLEKLTLAMIHARQQGMEVSFKELVQADRENRLAEKLNLPAAPSPDADAARSASPAAAPAASVCPKCGQPATGENKICRNCGAIL